MTPPSSPPSPTPEDLRHRLEAMTDRVVECEVRAARGEIIDMSQLDHDVAEFCRDLGRADPECGAMLTPLMAGMVSALEDLARTVADQCKKMGVTKH